MNDNASRSDLRARLRALLGRLDQQLRFQRELAWHPRLRVVVARDIGRTRREIELVRRRRGA